jgi:hypothetical protein
MKDSRRRRWTVPGKVANQSDAQSDPGRLLAWGSFGRSGAVECSTVRAASANGP